MRLHDVVCCIKPITKEMSKRPLLSLAGTPCKLCFLQEFSVHVGWQGRVDMFPRDGQKRRQVL